MQNMEQRIDELINSMTVKEKVGLCHANSKFTSTGVERLGIEELTMSDGPHGVREEMSRDNWDALNRDDDYCTYLPTATALAATWNPELGRRFGEVLGSEARFREKDIILGPGINIIRNPLCGRNFEYMSEDPCLVSNMVVPLIKGIQSWDTAACVKHYALNNQELDRLNVNVEVSKRALFEIYLKGFEAAVCEGGAYSVMGAYNRYENQYCCHNKYLVNDILKGKWKFSGVFLSDWSGTHSTEEAVHCGLDIEMGTLKPYNEFYLADAFEKMAVESQDVMNKLDDKVRRILRMMFRIHKLGGERKEGEFNTPEHQKTTYDIAAEAMVLLKNENVLPLKKDIKKILVVGDNATQKHAHGGNSCGVKAFYEVTQLEGIKNGFSDCEIEYVRTTNPRYDVIPVECLEIADMGAGSRAFRCEYYDDANFAKKADVKYQYTVIEDRKYKAARYSATVNIPEDGVYSFVLSGGGNVKFYVNGNAVEKGQNGKFKYTEAYDKREKVEILVESIGCSEEPLELLWTDSDEKITLDVLTRKASNVDCVIYCGGINHNYDVEEFDRIDMKLPEIQNIEIPALLKANSNMVIAMTAGSPVEMPWIEEAPAVIWNWYAGMEAGNVLADILLGKICPSGKMPYTLPKRLEDSPAIRYGEYQAGNCKYNEDIYVGYRGFDKDDIVPLFCFGHGLSYAQFKYENLVVETVNNGIKVAFELTNETVTDAAETAQIYVGLQNEHIECPVRELKAFKKVFLKGKETQKIEFLLEQDKFMIYDEKKDAWVVPTDLCTIEVGASSRDIRLKQKEVLIKF